MGHKAGPFLKVKINHLECKACFVEDPGEGRMPGAKFAHQIFISGGLRLREKRFFS
jgi:hypothetical protein